MQNYRHLARLDKCIPPALMSSASMDVCTCSSGKWDCLRSMSCVDDSPPFVVDPLPPVNCPKVSPVTSNVTDCADPSQQQCAFEYGINLPGAICQSKDVCICTSGKWDCMSSISCVDDSPLQFPLPPMPVTCPDMSPVTSNVTVCEAPSQQCTFQYSSTIVGGNCGNTDVCTCTNGIWDCSRSISCVDNSPPFVPAGP